MKFPIKPPVVQRKTAKPVAPPVYRPQPVPRVLQTKMATAPPVYRPQTSRIQPKMAGVVRPQPPVAQRMPAAPAANVVKRPVFPAPAKPQRVVAQTPKPPHTAASRTVQRQAKNTVQREVVFAPGSRTNVVNVAESVGRLVDFGITRTVLNGARYPGGGRAGFVSAIVEPRLGIERGPASVAVFVEAVPVQRVSYIMELPTRDGWEINIAAQNIKVKLASQDTADGVGIPIGPSESGDLTLNVKGHPNDGVFADMVRTHEDVHVRDIQRAVDAVLRPWDARLNDFRRLGTRFTGPNEITAIAKLYEAAGGTPEAIGDRFADMLGDLGNAFHATPAGKGPVIVGMARRGVFNGTLEVTLAHRAALRPLHERRLEEEAERTRFEEAVSASLSRPVRAPINAGGLGNSFITNDML